MKKAHVVLLLGGVIFICLVTACLYGLFHGYFDRGHFEVVRTTWSPENHVAVVAERWDSDALSGNQYFVLVDDHAPSSRELRYAYYHDGLVFRAGSDCLRVTWQDEHKLMISCSAGSINAQEIAVQKDQNDGIAVAYSGIPRKD